MSDSSVRNFNFGIKQASAQPDFIESSESDRRRIQMYGIFWRFYVGKHWRYKAEEGVPQLTFNYCKAFVDKSIAFLVGNGFKINSAHSNEIYKDLIEKELNRVWDMNDRELLAYEIAQMGSVAGDVWVKVSYDDDENKCVITPMNPSVVFPKWDGLNLRKMNEVTIATKYKEIDKKGQEVEVTYKEVMTKEKIIEYKDNVEVKGSKRENILGVLPIVHIRNLPISLAHWGMSDLLSLVSVNKEFNEKATDLTDTLGYQGSPVIVIKGAKAKNLDRGTNQVWGGLPRDSSVSTLDVGGGLEPTMKFLDVLKQTMHELSSIPEATLGKMQPISNTSGTALHIQYQPLMEKTKVKRLTYGQGFAKLNELVLRTLEVKEGLAIGSNIRRYDNEIIFEDPLPKDRTIELQNSEAELRMGVASRKEIMERMGKDEIESLIGDIDKDKMAEEALPFTANQQSAGDILE